MNTFNIHSPVPAADATALFRKHALFDRRSNIKKPSLTEKEKMEREISRLNKIAARPPFCYTAPQASAFDPL